MSNRPQIKRFALRVLLRMDGTPMPQPALIDAITVACGESTISDIATAIRELETDRLMSANRDEITEVITWTLTDKGEHKAKQLA